MGHAHETKARSRSVEPVLFAPDGWLKLFSEISHSGFAFLREVRNLRSHSESYAVISVAPSRQSTDLDLPYFFAEVDIEYHAAVYGAFSTCVRY